MRQPAASHLLEGHRKDVVVAASPLQFCRQGVQGLGLTERHLQDAVIRPLNRNAIGKASAGSVGIQEP